ncbi:MAG: LUD domain-containing protein, partial [Anaerolineales bacterium]|nr:LUD domain-containing protein [Anaerolineales bacterium]
MPAIFTESIRTAIEDETLQAALDLNARRRIEGRQAAMDTLDNPQAARRMAHAVRSEIIQNLDEHLERFTEKAVANGLIVHRADTPEQANRIVLEIIRQQGTNLVAKSKSMVSEELELNHALAAAGVQAVETDLGEYIVQLRKERPSHIITPAVHLTRDQVSDTFEQEIGTPPSSSIEDMTAAA